MTLLDPLSRNHIPPHTSCETHPQALAPSALLHCSTPQNATRSVIWSRFPLSIPLSPMPSHCAHRHNAKHITTAIPAGQFHSRSTPRDFLIDENYFSPSNNIRRVNLHPRLGLKMPRQSRLFLSENAPRSPRKKTILRRRNHRPRRMQADSKNEKKPSTHASQFQMKANSNHRPRRDANLPMESSLSRRHFRGRLEGGRVVFHSTCRIPLTTYTTT